MFNKRYKKRNKTYIIILFIFSLFISIGYSAVKDNLLVSTGAKFSPVPMVKSTYLDDTRYFRNSTYINLIKTITFEDEINIPSNAVASWDIGVNQNGDVMSYVVPNPSDSTYYDLYIQSNGKVYANKNMSSWFRNMKNVEKINNINLLDTQYTTNMNNLFTFFGANAQSVELDVSSWNTSNVTDMSGMFNNVGSNSPKVTLTLGSINTSKATDMSVMFYKTAYSDLNFTLDISSLDTSNVTDMSSMFRETAYNSTVFTLDVSSFDTRKVTNMNSMFKDTSRQSKVITLDISNFDTSNVTDMSSMFAFTGYYNPSFTLDVSNFNTSNVTDMSYMFRSTGYSSTNFTLDVSNFNTSKVTDMEAMFRNTAHSSTVFTLDLSNFNTSNVTDMSYMFRGTGYKSTIFALDVSSFDTSKVTAMNDMFYSCGFDSLSFTLDVSNFDTSNVTNMSNMFRETGYTSEVFTLDLSNFDTSNVTDMSYMFRSSGENSPIFNLNLSSFDTSNVTNMEDMFYSMSNNSTALNFEILIQNPNTTSYTDMFNAVAVNEGNKITVNYTTETETLVDQMIATKSSKSNVVKGKLIVIVDKLKVGDEITIDTEKFNVISNNDETITMLAQYSLSTNYRQSTTANPVKFSDTTGWAYSPGPKEIDINTWSTYIPTYINEYLKYLKNEVRDSSISSNLITLKELKTLGCSIDDKYSWSDQHSCSDSPYYSWLINSQTWWTRSAFSGNSNIWTIHSKGSDFNAVQPSNSCGVRPVVTIPKTSLNNYLNSL